MPHRGERGQGWGYESRSGLYFANPYVVDWALAWALRGVASATALRERLATDILASVNEDGSFGRYDVSVSTALAILALTSLGVGGEAVRRSRLRLADLMMPDGTWPSSIPFYSTVKIPQERLPAGMLARLMLGKRQGQFLWLEGEVHAVSLYVDGYRMMSSALAYLALTPSGHSAESGFTALPRQRRESCHPRYRCADHIQYIADYALPPYLVPRWARVDGGRLALGRQLVNVRVLPRGALTTGHRRRIRIGDNSIARAPNLRVAPGGGGPTRTFQGPRGESPGHPGVGLDSFGPNPTANPVGVEEGGR